MKTKAERAKGRALKAFMNRIWKKIYENAEVGSFEVTIEISESIEKYFVEKMRTEKFDLTKIQYSGRSAWYRISWS